MREARRIKFVTELVASLSDHDLDFLVHQADSPARVLYARV